MKHLIMRLAAVFALLCVVVCPCLGETGTVELPWDKFEIMYSAEGSRDKSARGQNGKCSLPVGDYHLRTITLHANDSQDRQWSMRSRRIYVPLNIKSDRVVKLPVTQPFTARVTASRNRVVSGTRVNISLEIVDGNGRVYNPPRSRSRSTREDKPKVLLKHADGREITTLTLEYG